MNFHIVPLEFPSVEKQSIEIVERKGLGHPDTLSDALAEEYSIALSKFYYENFGRVLHHNVDKALLVGGETFPVFGGGEVKRGIDFYLVGRATTEFDNVKVPVIELYEESAREWIKNNLRYLDPYRYINFKIIVRPGSPDLVDLFMDNKGNPLSNDTSFGVGFAPLSPTERAVLDVERYLNSIEFKERHKESGEDVKVMAVRYGEVVDLTVAIAFVSRYVSSIDDYMEKKEMIKREVEEYINGRIAKEIRVSINSADDLDRGRAYITVTGSSAEGGDDGQVGRGNRANGLITPMRPMSLEAVSGKNPISHVGKLYNVAARDVAERIVNELDEVEECHVFLVSQIGKPITEPQITKVSIRTKKGSITNGIRERVKVILKEEMETLPDVWKRFIRREITIY